MIDEIKANQDKDPSFIKLRETVQSRQTSGFEIRDDVLRRGNRLCVPDVDGLRQRILQEAIMHLIVFIQESPRCTRMLKVCIGGMG